MRNANVSLNQLLSVILLLIVLIMLILFVGRTKRVMDEKHSYEECKQDVRMASIRNAAGEPGFEYEMRCPPEEITIKGNAEQIKQALARNMLRCWDKFGRGKANLFPNKRASYEKYCVICSYIHFAKKNLKVTGFLDYLMTHKPYPPDTENPKATYFEIFYGKAPSTEDKTFAEQHKDSYIDTSQDYAIMFTYAKKVGYWDKLQALQVGGLAGGAAGGLTVLALGGPIGWIAMGSFAGMSAIGIFATSIAPWNTEKEWTAGIYLIPFKAEKILELKCTKLGR